MAVIYLIRHGQASFGAANYDELSAMGHIQAAHVGRWLATVNAGQVDRLIGGSLKRHQQTAQGAIQAWQDRLPSAKLPALETDPRLNEYDHIDFLEVAKRELAADSFSLNPAMSRTEFHKMFELAFSRWTKPDYAHQYKEPFERFQTRVLAGLEALLAANRPTTIVFSSGGAIATIVQAMMGLDTQRMMSINTLMANAAVTKVVFSGSKRSVAYFNNYGFLEGEHPELVSFR
jgi:broad specificity phosphatase PhoE